MSSYARAQLLIGMTASLALGNIDAPIIWGAVFSWKPAAAVVGQGHVLWASASSVAAEALGLSVDREAGRAPGRSADRVQLVATGAAQGQVQSVGQVQWADQAQMEVS